MRLETSLRRGRSARHGSVLLFAAVMLGIAAIAVAWVVAMVWSHMRQTARAEARLRAFYAAESGVQQVIDWFNRGYYAWFEIHGNPVSGVQYHDWSDGLFENTNGFQDLFAPFADGAFVNDLGESSFLHNQPTQTSVVVDKRPESPQNSDWFDYLPSLTDPTTQFSSGFVEYLEIRKPDHPSPPGSYGGTICHVISVGKDPSTGAVSTVETNLIAPFFPSILAPAALMSKLEAASGGQFEVHWGEVWTHGNLDLTNPISQKYWNAMKDPWFHGRSEAWIIGKDATDKTWYADGLSDGGFALNPPSGANYYQPFKQLSPKNQGKFGGYQDSFYQNTTLQWPDYDYNVVKTYCLRHDRPIYRTTKDGLLIVGTDSSGNPVTDKFENVFHNREVDGQPMTDPDMVNRDRLPPVYFIDTTDGEPPKPDGSNVPTINVTGSGDFFYGYFFVAANVYFGGSGNSPAFDSPERPDRTIAKTPIKNCRIMGLLYSYGAGSFQGEGDVFGTLYAKKGFEGGGNWAIWYDWRLGDPRRNSGSHAEPERWDTYYHYFPKYSAEETSGN